MFSLLDHFNMLFFYIFQLNEATEQSAFETIPSSPLSCELKTLSMKTVQTFGLLPQESLQLCEDFNQFN